MEYKEQVSAFAKKWIEKFRNREIDYIELVDHDLADDCEALGFQMDCGKSFSDKYGIAVGNDTELAKIIDDITDIQLLGSAIYSRWRYFNHWAYDAAAILETKNRTWFLLALDRLATLAGDDLTVFSGGLKEIHIVSNRLGYGCCPEPGEEVEQHLTINSDGSVCFETYAFGKSCDGTYEKVRTENQKFPVEMVERIISAFKSYFGNGYSEVFATDIGSWQMNLLDKEGRNFTYSGSLCAKFKVDGIDLSDLVRDSLAMPYLYMFDGNDKPDPINRIEIFYHRITKIPQKKVKSEHPQDVIWDYTESLIINREDESIEHIQNIGTGCTVNRKYKVEGGISSLLDELDIAVLFTHIEGNPENVVFDPKESRDYTINICTAGGIKKTIQGTYDRKGLPDDWEDFIKEVFDFITFYGWGEIMSPSIYNKVRRCDTDLIYCSVAFEEGYKSYYYIADDDSIEVGDFVVAPAGRDNHEAIVYVEKKEYFAKEDVPLPIEKTKHIIRKCTEKEVARINT